MTPRGRCSALAVGMLSVGLAFDVPAQRGCADAASAEVAGGAESKIVLLERLIDGTAPVQRVESSGHTDAMKALGDARASAAEARSALGRGCGADAQRFAEIGLARASTAFKLVRKAGAVDEREYRQLSERTTSLLEILKSRNEEEWGIDAADMVGIERQISRAAEAAINGEIPAAITQLLPVADRLERRIVAIYDRRTILYDRTFAGPEDEYAYVAEQYRGYRLLIDRAEATREVPFAATQSYEQFLAYAEELADEATRQSESGDWQSAVKTMQEAVVHCERATRLLGIGF